MEYYTLQNGHRMPKVGLGLWQGSYSSDVMEAAIEAALEAGYRLFDTAYFYQTENMLGKCINKWIDAGKGKREDLFIVTKLPTNGMTPTRVEHFLDLSLKELGLSYVDLYLIHWPYGVKYNSDRDFFPFQNGKLDLDFSTDHVGIWKAMEGQVDCGKAKAIGVSNFNISQIERLVKIARILPSNNQVECHVYFQQKELISACAKYGITTTAYFPLGGSWKSSSLQLSAELPASAHLLDDPIVKSIAEKHGKSVGQILLKFMLHLGVAVIPKSSNPGRVKENIELFNFNLDSNDLKKLEALEKGKEGRSITTKNDRMDATIHPECPF